MTDHSNRQESAPLDNALRAVWDKARAQITDSIERLEDAVTTLLLGGQLEEQSRRAAERSAHQLAGSAGTFGFPDGSRAALELEGLLAGESPPNPQRMSELVVALRHILLDVQTTSETPTTDHSTRDALPRLLIVTPDAVLASALATAATDAQLQPVLAATPAEGLEQADLRPAAVVFDLGTGADAQAQLDQITLLRTVPIVAVAHAAGVQLRADAARLGVAGFAERRDPRSAIETVSRLIEEPHHGGSILAVDDDPVIREWLSGVLKAAGFTVNCLGDATDFWTELRRAPPDLVLVDVDMPVIDGIALCRLLRQDAAYRSLPIIFLTSGQDPATEQRAFDAGADDFLLKPIAPAALITRVRNRLRRRPPAPLARPPRASQPAPPEGAMVDILLVEDDPVIAQLLLQTLEARDYSVRWLNDGSAAATALLDAQSPLMPRLILLDVDLPGLDGFALLRRLRNEGRLENTRVIVLTVRSSEPEIVKALELDAYDHMAKPFSTAVLLQRVRQALA